MTTEHTATPWHIAPNTGPLALPGTTDLYNVVRIEGRAIRVIAENITFNDAKFIRISCNAHNDLVAALQLCLAALLRKGGDEPETLRAARGALFKASALLIHQPKKITY